jgi:hypothetical protein
MYINNYKAFYLHFICAKVQQTLLAYVPFNKQKQLAIRFLPILYLMDVLLLPAKGVPRWSMQPQTIFS